MATACVKECLGKIELTQPFIGRQTSHRMYNKIWKLLVVSSVVLTMAMVAVVIRWRAIRLNITSPREQELCVAASSFDLSLNFDLEEMGLTEKDTQTVKKLCGKTSVILSLLVEKAVNEWSEEYDPDYLPMIPDGCPAVTYDTPSGHVHGIDFEEMTNDENGIIRWKSAKLSLKGGIEYENGRFLVKDSGYYYVSSQVKFSDTGSAQFDISPVYSDNDGTFIHTIYRQFTGLEYADKLLEAAKTLCEPLVEDTETTSVTGAVFYFHEGDSVYVATPSPYKLKASDESNHFSLYMV